MASLFAPTGACLLPSHKYNSTVPQRNISLLRGINLDLSIVIVSWNVRGLLEACLTSVYESLRGSSLRTEVWVVDNASTDGSAELVRKRFPQTKLMANETNVGFAAANNQALRAMGFSFHGKGEHKISHQALFGAKDAMLLDLRSDEERKRIQQGKPLPGCNSRIPAFSAAGPSRGHGQQWPV